MKRISTLVIAFLVAAVAGSPVRAETKLTTEVFTASPQGFLVNSALVSGEKEAVLIDGQLTLSDAHRLVGMILDSKKTLTTVYVTHWHPDHYFGLVVVKQAFPEGEDRRAAGDRRRDQEDLGRQGEAVEPDVRRQPPHQAAHPVAARGQRRSRSKGRRSRSTDRSRGTPRRTPTSGSRRRRRSSRATSSIRGSSPGRPRPTPRRARPGARRSTSSRRWARRRSSPDTRSRSSRTTPAASRRRRPT